MTNYRPGVKKPHIVKRGAAHYECYYQGKDHKDMEFGLLEEGVCVPTPR